MKTMSSLMHLFSALLLSAQCLHAQQVVPVKTVISISPAGKVLPCHAAESITGMEFDSIRSNKSIRWIWDNSEAFNKYRGTEWMPEPCKSCEFKEVDFGGCRCQAFALTGSAGNTDPACAKSPLHAGIFTQASTEAAEEKDRFLYRNFSGGSLESENL